VAEHRFGGDEPGKAAVHRHSPGLFGGERGLRRRELGS